VPFNPIISENSSFFFPSHIPLILRVPTLTVSIEKREKKEEKTTERKGFQP